MFIALSLFDQPFSAKFLHENELILQRKESSLLELVNAAEIKSCENAVLISRVE